MNQQKILITKTKRDELKVELHDLIEVERKKVIKQLQDAREQGDLSENADYDAAKDKQTEIEKRISSIQIILENAEITSEVSKVTNKVVIQSYVQVKDLEDDLIITYKIVGQIEADPDLNMISNDSPLAKVLMDRKIGDIVEVKGIDIHYKVEILKISPVKI